MKHCKVKYRGGKIMLGNPVQSRTHWARKAHRDFFWVSRNYKILYCSVEKAGCSSTKLVLKKINDGKFLGRDRGAITKDEFKNFTKILFVREPVERFVSAFRFITITNAEKLAWVKADIVQRYRKVNSDIEKQPNVTFEEFVRYFLDGRRIKRHTITIENLCRPCQVNYDYIGKYESFTKDLANLLVRFSNITFDDATSFVQHTNQGPGEASAKLADVYMKNLSANLRE